MKINLLTTIIIMMFILTNAYSKLFYYYYHKTITNNNPIDKIYINTSTNFRKEKNVLCMIYSHDYILLSIIEYKKRGKIIKCDGKILKHGNDEICLISRGVMDVIFTCKCITHDDDDGKKYCDIYNDTFSFDGKKYQKIKF